MPVSSLDDERAKPNMEIATNKDQAGTPDQGRWSPLSGNEYLKEQGKRIPKGMMGSKSSSKVEEHPINKNTTLSQSNN